MSNHPIKTTPVLLPADGEASWLLLPSLVPLLSISTVQLENTDFCILKVAGQVCKSQKRISIYTNHSYTTKVHFPKPVSSDPKNKPDSVLTNSTGNDELQSWSM